MIRDSLGIFGMRHVKRDVHGGHRVAALTQRANGISFRFCTMLYWLAEIVFTFYSKKYNYSVSYFDKPISIWYLYLWIVKIMFSTTRTKRKQKKLTNFF